jgi:hypothetical protein
MSADAKCAAALKALAAKPLEGGPVPNYVEALKLIAQLWAAAKTDKKETERIRTWTDAVIKSITRAVVIADARTGKEELSSPKTSSLRAALTRVNYELWKGFQGGLPLAKELLNHKTDADPTVSALRDLSIQSFYSQDGENPSPALSGAVEDVQKWPPERELHEHLVSLSPVVADVIETVYSHDPSTVRAGVPRFQPFPYLTFIGESDLAKRCHDAMEKAQRRRNSSTLAVLLNQLILFTGERANKSFDEVASDLVGMAKIEVPRPYLLSVRNLSKTRPRQKTGQPSDGSMGVPMPFAKEEKNSAKTPTPPAAAAAPRPVAKSPEIRGSLKILLLRVLKESVCSLSAFRSQEFMGNHVIKISETRVLKGQPSVFVAVCPTEKARNSYLRALDRAEFLVDTPTYKKYSREDKENAKAVLKQIRGELSVVPLRTLDPKDEKTARAAIDAAAEVAEKNKGVNGIISASAARGGGGGGGGGGAKSSVGASGTVAWTMSQPAAPAASTKDLYSDSDKSNDPVTLEEAAQTLAGAAGGEWQSKTTPRKKVRQQLRLAEMTRMLEQQKRESELTVSSASNAKTSPKPTDVKAATPAKLDVSFSSGLKLSYSKLFKDIETARVFVTSDLSTEVRMLVKSMHAYSGNSGAESDVVQYWQKRVGPIHKFHEIETAGAVIHGSKQAEMERLKDHISRRLEMYTLSVLRSVGPNAVSQTGYSRKHWEVERVFALANFLASLAQQLEAANFRQGYSTGKELYRRMPAFYYVRQSRSDNNAAEEKGDSWYAPPIERSRDSSNQLKRPLEDPACSEWRRQAANFIFHARNSVTAFASVCSSVSKEALKGTPYEFINVLMAFFNPGYQVTAVAPASQARAVLSMDTKDVSKVGLRAEESKKTVLKTLRVSALEAQIAVRNKIVDSLVQLWMSSGDMHDSIGTTQSYRILQSSFVDPWVRRYTIAFARRFGIRDEIIPAKGSEQLDQDKSIFRLPQYVSPPTVPGLFTARDPVLAARLSFFKSRDLDLFQHLSAIERVAESSVCSVSILYNALKHVNALRCRCAVNSLAREWFDESRFATEWDTLDECDAAIQVDVDELKETVVKTLVAYSFLLRKSGSSLVERKDLKKQLAMMYKDTTAVLPNKIPSLYNRLLDVFLRITGFATEDRPLLMLDSLDHALGTFMSLLRRLQDKDAMRILRKETAALSAKFVLKPGTGEKEASLLHRYLWEGDFCGCQDWCKRNLVDADGPDSDSSAANRTALRDLLYAASGHHHNFVKLKGIIAVKSAAVQYVSGTGARLASQLRDIAWQSRAYSERITL